MGKIHSVLILLLGSCDRPVRIAMIMLFSVILVGSGLQSYQPMMFRAIVDHLAKGMGRDVWLPAAAFVAIFALSRLMNETQWYFMGLIQQPLMNKIRLNFLKNFHALPYHWHLTKSQGEIEGTLGAGLQGVRSILYSGVLGIAPLIVEISAAIIIVFSCLNWILSAIFLASLVCYLGVLYGTIRRFGAFQKDTDHAFIEMQKLASDLYLASDITKINGRYDFIEERFRERLSGMDRMFWRFYKARAETGLLQASTIAVFFGVTNLTGLYLYQAGTVGLGDFVVINLYIIQFIRPLDRINFMGRDTLAGIVQCERLLAFLARPLGRDGACTLPRRAQGIAITAERIEFSFGAKRIFQALSFSVAPGQTLVIAGPSGIGKTILMKCLSGLLKPDGGKLYFDAIETHDMRLSSFQEQSGYVPQNPILYDMSIFDNVKAGNPDATDEEITSAIEAVRLGGLLERDDRALNVGELGQRLSGGERQRVALARALVKHPRLLLLDEITASLDRENGDAVMALIWQLFPDATKLFITHRVEEIRNADLVLELGHA